MARYIDVDKFAEKICDFQAIDENAANAMIWLLRTFPTEKVAPIADTVRKMHSEIKERCIKGGIYPAFVASTIDQIEKEMLEDL